jgi:hypothetical protein
LTLPLPLPPLLFPPQLTLTLTLLVAVPNALVAVTAKVCTVPPNNGLPVIVSSPLLLIVKAEVGVVGLMAKEAPPELLKVTLPIADPAVQEVTDSAKEGWEKVGGELAVLAVDRALVAPPQEVMLTVTVALVEGPPGKALWLAKAPKTTWKVVAPEKMLAKKIWPV